MGLRRGPFCSGLCHWPRDTQHYVIGLYCLGSAPLGWPGLLQLCHSRAPQGHSLPILQGISGPAGSRNSAVPLNGGGEKVENLQPGGGWACFFYGSAGGIAGGSATMQAEKPPHGWTGCTVATEAGVALGNGSRAPLSTQEVEFIQLAQLIMCLSLAFASLTLQVLSRM